MIEYTYAEYKFEFAVWAASKGITAGSAPKGFTIEKARCILKAIGFYGLVENGAEWLPDPKYFDERHYTWCKEVCEKAEDLGIKTVPEDENDHRYWSDGRSAKLINVFLKTLTPLNLETLPDGEEKAKWYAVHPPIDRTVLEGMNHKDNEIRNEIRFGCRYKDIWITLPGTKGEPSGTPSWQQFEYKDYQKVINMIRCNLRECGYEDPLPLWRNERFFKP